MTAYLLPAFQAVSMIFAIASVGTGAQAMLDPVGFSRSFGLLLAEEKSKPAGLRDETTKVVRSFDTNANMAKSYISLMGIRQLATGLTLFAFAYQRQWQAAATILSIIGFVVAGTDGIYLWQYSSKRAGLFHALPGAGIALLALAVLYFAS